MFKTKCIRTTKIVSGLLALMLVTAGLLGCGASAGQNSEATVKPSETAAAPTEDVSAQPEGETAPEPAGSAEDLTISVSELSETPKFYKTEANGTNMEIIALVASDGSVRTAFNTCQVCFASGRGYYETDGSALVCQNCGNRFTGDAVGVEGGGCNPVPITESNRSEQDGIITISGELLSEASVIFANWK